MSNPPIPTATTLARAWIGHWLMAVAILHTLFALLVFRPVYADLLRRGLFDTVGQDPMRAAAVWFLLFGAAFAALAHAVHVLERMGGQHAALRRLGAALLAMCVAGIVLMPASGFWLGLPAAAALLAKRLNRAAGGTMARRGLTETWKDRWHALRRRLFRKLVDMTVAQAGLQRRACQMPYGRQVYLDSGERAGARTLVLLHGAGADMSTWLALVRALGTRDRVLAPDLPGHGDSTLDVALDYSIPAQADRLLQWLAALELGPVWCVGSSMGGAIALRLAHVAPQAVAGLVLIGSAGAQSRPSWLLRQMEQGGRNVMADIDSIDGYRRMLAVAMVKPLYLPTWVLRLLLDEKVRHAAVDRKVMADIEHSLDQRHVLQGIQAPTLILWGRDDRIMHVDDADLLQRSIAASHKEILDGTGHVPMVERPRRVARSIRRFLEQH